MTLATSRERIEIIPFSWYWLVMGGLKLIIIWIYSRPYFYLLRKDDWEEESRHLNVPNSFSDFLKETSKVKECISLENWEIVAISTDKNTFLMDILIKLTLKNIFITLKKSARAAPTSQNNQETLVSPKFTPNPKFQCF